ncbi:MAG: phosphatase PAP2 family protein [Gammaproteobacteria bacterium]
MLNTLTGLDNAIYRRLVRLQHISHLIPLVRLISRSGDGYLYGIFGALLFAAGDSESLQFLQAGLLAFLMELPCFMGLKAFIKRDRPFVHRGNPTSLITPADKFSMPSGHSAAAFLMATLAAVYFPALGVSVYCWATLIGLSRILLGVHYPGDVIAGAALGSSCAVMGIVLTG